MMILSTRRFRGRALAALLGSSAACSNDPGLEPQPIAHGLRIVAGGTGTDTVQAQRTQALVVEVRDSTGRPMSGVAVRFEAPPPPLGQRAAAMFVCPVTATLCFTDGGWGVGGGPMSTTAITSSTGRATAQVRHGAVAGVAWVRIAVPEIGALDSVQYTTTAGAPHEVRLLAPDTTLRVGQALQLPSTAARVDRFGNDAGVVPATVVSTDGTHAAAQRTVTWNAVGRGRVVFDAGGVADTLFTSVVPDGVFAMVRGDTLIRSHFDGTGQTRYLGLRAVDQYGLHPSWTGQGAHIIVHSASYAGLTRVALLDGRVTTIPTVPGLSREWYPDATLPWIAFTGESSTGGFRVWLVRQDGTGHQEFRATTPAYANYYRPTLSPDGTKLAVSVVQDGIVGVRVFDFATGAAVSPFVGLATAPRWSHDGQWLAMSRPQGGPVRVMRPDGSGLRAVGTVSLGEWIDWTRDGEWLVGSQQDRIALVRVSDGEVVPLPFTVGAWQPAVPRALQAP